MVNIPRDLDVLDVGPALEIFRRESQRISNLEQQDFLNQIRLRREERADTAEGRAQSAEARAQQGFQIRQKLSLLKMRETEQAIEDANADRFLRKVATLAPGADTPQKVAVLKKKLTTLAQRLKIDDADEVIGNLNPANRGDVAGRARLGLTNLQDRKTLAQIDRLQALTAKTEAEATAAPGQAKLERQKLEAQIKLQEAKTKTEEAKRGQPAKPGEFERLVDRAATETDPVKKKAIVDRINKLSQTTTGVTIDVDRETGNISVTQGAPAAPAAPAGPGAPAIPKRLQVTGNRADKLRGNAQMLQTAEDKITEMLDEVEANPAVVGSRGSVRSFVERNVGGAIDLAEIGLPKVITDRLRTAKEKVGEATGLGEGPTPGEISSLEDFLATALAQARAPNQDRILTSILKDAKDDVKLTGLTSTTDVRNRLVAILEEIRRGKQIFQDRLQRGVTGRAQPRLTPEQEAAKAELERRRGAR